MTDGSPVKHEPCENTESCFAYCGNLLATQMHEAADFPRFVLLLFVNCLTNRQNKESYGIIEGMQWLIKSRNHEVRKESVVVHLWFEYVADEHHEWSCLSAQGIHTSGSDFFLFAS